MDGKEIHVCSKGGRRVFFNELADDVRENEWRDL
jgi:hypothetical protein